MWHISYTSHPYKSLMQCLEIWKKDSAPAIVFSSKTTYQAAVVPRRLQAARESTQYTGVSQWRCYTRLCHLRSVIQTRVQFFGTVTQAAYVLALSAAFVRNFSFLFSAYHE